MSVHFWGEDPRGLWTLSVTDNGHNNRQHHHVKSKYGDTEDAAEILQDEMDGKDRGDEFESAEEFENDIFKDASFKSRHSDGGGPNRKQSTHLSDKLQEIIKEKKAKSQLMKSKNEKAVKIKGSTHAHSKNKETTSDVTQDERSDESEAEEKILAEILGTKQTDHRTEPTVSLLNATKNGLEERVSNSSMTSHNNTLHNTTSQNAVSADSIVDLNATGNNNNGETNEPETKMLESLLRGVISQVFSNFLHSDSQNPKSFEDRISTLESLLGANKGGGSDDKMVSGLMNAFKSGKAIDRVNNVLDILVGSKNDTKLNNSSFSRNAEVVVDVLKVLKDVLDTGKGNKNLKNYQERVANLLEKQSGSTEKLTKKLLSDLKLSGTDSSDVVNDALALISRIFQSEKRKSTKRKLSRGKKTPKKYRIMFEGPNSEIELPYSSIKNIFAAADGHRKVISKTSKTKEIQRDDDVEKITVESIKIKNDKKKHSKKLSQSRKIGNALRHAVEESMDDDDENIENNIDPFMEEDFVAAQPQNDGFTLTITKNGEKVGERKVNNLQAVKMLQKSRSTTAEKKQAINDDQANIDVEVVVDGKKQPKAKTIKHSSAPTKHKDQTKTIKLKLTSDPTPKSVIHDLTKKKADILSSVDRKHNRKTTKKPPPGTNVLLIKNTTENMMRNYDEDEPILPFLPFNENEASFPGGVSENFIPSFGPNNFPNFESPFISFPSYGNNERATFNERYSNHFQDTSFETPVRNPPFSVAKRSELAGYGYQMPFQFYSFPHPTTVPHARNYRSVDFYSDEDKEDDETRTKREVDDNDGDFYFFDKNDATNLFDDSGHDTKVLPETIAVKPNKNDNIRRSIDLKATKKNDKILNDVRHRRRRRSIDVDSDVKNKLLIREKRSDVYDDSDTDGDGEDDGPHVVKRSAIFSELYPSKQPTLSSYGDEGYKMTKAEKRSAIRKALALEKSLRRNLFSMKRESSSALDVIKRVHNDIANADARDLRILEKELANGLDPSKYLKTSDDVLKKDDTSREEEPINNFITLIEQTENSSTRKTIPDDQKQSPEEYYKYGTSTSGILVSWTLKFHGTD